MFYRMTEHVPNFPPDFKRDHAREILGFDADGDNFVCFAYLLGLFISFSFASWAIIVYKNWLKILIQERYLIIYIKILII